MRFLIPEHAPTIFRETDSMVIFITISLLQHTQYISNRSKYFKIWQNYWKVYNSVAICHVSRLHIINCRISQLIPHAISFTTYIPPTYSQFISKNFNFWRSTLKVVYKWKQAELNTASIAPARDMQYLMHNSK